MEENDIKIRERVTALEAELKAVSERVVRIDEIVSSIKEVVTELKQMRSDVNRIDIKVTEMEQKPSKRIETAVAAIIGTVVGGSCSALISFFTGG